MSPKSAVKKAVKSKRVAKKQTPKQKPAVTAPSTNGNPFRPGSSYGRIFEILASHPGISRSDLLKRSMKPGKDAQHASFDVSVILSAKNSPTGKRHRSCRPGFWIEKTADGLLTLRTD